MLLFDSRRPLVRRTAIVAVTIFFNATLLLSARPGGFIGIGVAHAAPPAAGSDRPSLYVVPFQRGGEYVSEMAVKKVETYYRTLLSMNPDVVPTDAAVKPDAAPEAVAPVKPLVQDKVLEAADKALWKGKDLMREKKWRPAVKQFNAAVKRYQKKIAILEDMDKMVEAMLLKAIARFAQGYEDDGEETLAEVLVLRPDLVVDRRWQSPAFTGALNRLKSGLFKVPTGSLNVTCPSNDCRVFVDGVLRGSQGATIDGLPRGHHWVRVVAAGYEPWAKRVFTPAKGKTRNVVAKAKPAKGAARVMTARTVRKQKAAQVSPELMASFVREGRYGSDFLVKAGEFARQADVDHIVMGFINRVGDQYVVAGYVYSAERQQVAEVSKTLVQLDISDMQVKLLDFEQSVSKAVKEFPMRRVVTESPPRVYAAYRPPPSATPPVAVAPVATAPVATAPTPSAPAPTVAVPVPVPTRVATAPTPPAQPVYQPQAHPAQPVYQPQPTTPPAQPVYQPPYQPRPAQPPAQPVYQPQPRYGQPAAQPGTQPVPTYQPPGQYGQPPAAQPGQYGQVPAAQPGQYGQPPTARPGQYGQAPTAQPGQYGQPPAAQPPAAQPAPVAAPTAPPAAPTEMRRPLVRPSTPFTVVARAPASAAAPAQQPGVVVVDEPEEEGGVHTKWWFWVAVIGGAAAVSAAIAVPLALQGDDPSPTGASASIKWE